MSEITYIATVGIKAFLVQGKILNAQDKQMVLAQPIDAVQTVFTRTGMDKILPITDSIDAAIKRVAAE
jgi:anti-anti-sigma factor